MFSESTVLAITAIASADKGATANEMLILEDALRCFSSVHSVSSIHSNDDKMLTYKEVSLKMRMSLSTVKRLVKQGRLAPVIGTGCRAIGISKESYLSFLKGQKK